MNFELGNNIVSEGVTLDQLRAQCKTEKEKKSIESIFNKFDKNSDGTLQDQEQIDFMNFYHSADVGGNENGKISRREMRHAKKEAGLTDLKTKDLKRFMEAYNATVEQSQDAMALTYNDDGSVEASRTDTDGSITSTTTVTYEQGDDKSYTKAEVENTRQDSAGNSDTRTYDSSNRLVKIRVGNQELTLQENGNYKTSSGDEFIFWKDGQLRSVKDTSGRVLREQSEGNFYQYSYDKQDQQSTVPKQIVHTDSDNNTITYSLSADGKTYKDLSGKSFTFDPQTHTFTEVKAESTPAPAEKTYTRVAEVKDKTQRIRINYTSNEWRNAKVDFNSDELKSSASQIKSSVTAEEVMDRMLKAKGIDTSGINVDKLKQDLIKNNPSVFDPSTGDVWGNAKWDKLDFPKDLSKYQSM